MVFGRLLSRVGHPLRCASAAIAVSLALGSCSQQAAEPAAATKVSAAPTPAGSSEQRLRLMTSEQYLNTLGYVFGPNVKPDVRFAPLQRTDGLLGVGTSIAGVTAGQMEVYQKTAASVAAQVVNTENRKYLISCTPKSETARDDACARTFLTKVSRLLYRRPLEEKRVDQWVAEAGAGADRLKDFYAGLGSALEGMLFNPQVLFISERLEADPKQQGGTRLDSYALATRLSFFLWNAAPDDMLLKAAEKGELQTEKGFAKSVDRMLASPRLEYGVRAFFDDMLAFDVFDTLAKDGSIYPNFTATTVLDAREQTLRTVVDHLITKKRDYRDLYTTRETFLSPSLAALYRLPTTGGWVPYEFPADSPRMGMLTQISFLAGHSHPGRSSATLRGKALRELLLCQPVPRPPANVDFSAVENPKANLRTARDRVNAHLENPVCAGCHKITDPMGLALENFDGAGRYRLTERGTTIDASGNLDGKAFTNVTGLATALRDHPALTSCVVKRAYAYGTGGPTSAGDRATLESLDKQFAANGYRFTELLRAVVTSKAFSQVSAAEAVTADAAATHATARAAVATN
jgi:hypothetical protein